MGTNNLVVAIGNLENERNTTNNTREVAVEVVDEKTNIAIISDMQHPDIGALKKSIESNEQRSVSISKPTADSMGWDDVDLFILYQPTQNFREVYKYLQQKKANSFTITGSQTDWGFLNKIQSSFLANSYHQSEELMPKLNPGFTIFNVSDFSTLDFPPLEGTLGEITVLKPHEMVMTQRIKGVDLNQPLLAVLATDLEREAVLFGENIWKWRMQSYRNDQNFNNFDTFMGKLVLFLATTKAKSRFSIDFETVYQGNGDAKIKANYFDNTFVFDPNANITLELIEKNQQRAQEYPMLLKNGYYETDLTDLAPGKYAFTAKVANENLSNSGSFTVLDFNVEQQFLSSDYKKLDRLAESTKGKMFYPSQLQRLIEDLSTSDRFSPTQKSEQNVVSLIDFRFLLGIIAATLSLEWFIRKYNGLI